MMTKTSAGKSPAKSSRAAAATPAPEPAVAPPAKLATKRAAKTAPAVKAPAKRGAKAPAKSSGQNGAKAPAKAAAKRAARTRAPASEPSYVHPRSVANVLPDAVAEAASPPAYTAGVVDEINPELRYRMISDIAYRRYVDRGYADGSDVDDWLQAEAEVEHLLATRGRPADDGG